jgi:hypothetical protein
MIDPRQKHRIQISILEKELKDIIREEPTSHTKNKRYKEILDRVVFHEKQIEHYNQMINHGVKF